MALLKTIQVTAPATVQTFAGPVSAGDATVTKEVRCTITNVISTKDNAEAFVQFSGDGISSIGQYDFVPNLDGPNIIKQAYEHLKTLPEFAGAADV